MDVLYFFRVYKSLRERGRKNCSMLIIWNAYLLMDLFIYLADAFLSISRVFNLGLALRIISSHFEHLMAGLAFING